MKYIDLVHKKTLTNHSQITLNFISLIPPENHLLIHRRIIFYYVSTLFSGKLATSNANRLICFYLRRNVKICKYFDKTHIKCNQHLFSLCCENAIFWHYDFVYLHNLPSHEAHFISPNVIRRWNRLLVCSIKVCVYSNWYE